MKKTEINPIPPNFEKYINLVADVELEQAFDESLRQLDEIDRSLLNSLQDKTCAPDKWTIKETLLHLADSDRIMSYQALMLARRDDTVLPGYNQVLHVQTGKAESRAIDDLIEEIRVARKATKSMFSAFDDEMLLSKAIRWKYEISALAMGFTIIGHQIHHLKIIEDEYYPLLGNGKNL